MTCPWCLGDGASCREAAGKDLVEKVGASRCRGSGKVMTDRCPRALADGRARAVVSSLVLYEQGLTPVSGGWLEQTAIWRREMNVALGERNKIEAAEMERARREAEANSKK